MTRPVIGLTTAFTKGKWSVWDMEAAIVAATYFQAVDKAGGIPVLLPPSGGDAGDVIRRFDGLVFIGGGDINPHLYETPLHASTNPVMEQLDKWQIALMKEAIDQNVPFLAICRGLQLLNIIQGGTLHQHLPELLGHMRHAPAPGVKGKHLVQIVKGSILEPIVGLQPEVITYHHQAIDRLGNDLAVIAWSEDGIIEAAHLATHPWGVGVQWHPEEEEDLLLMKEFISIARTHAGAAVRQYAFVTD